MLHPEIGSVRHGRQVECEEQIGGVPHIWWPPAERAQRGRRWPSSFLPARRRRCDELEIGAAAHREAGNWSSRLFGFELQFARANPLVLAGTDGHLDVRGRVGVPRDRKRRSDITSESRAAPTRRRTSKCPSVPRSTNEFARAD